MNFSRFINFKNVLFGTAIFAVIFAVLAFSGKIPLFGGSKASQKLTGTLQVWGTIPKNSMSGFVNAFDKEAKTYNMKYTEVAEDDFDSKLILALADGYAPDLVIAPSNVAFANQNRITYTSPTTLSESNFRNMFVDAASILINMPAGYLALPLSIDPLVLYYNRDILSSNGYSTPPTTWGDFYSYANKITKYGEYGDIKMSTIAFGTYNNIPHITDIIMSMIMQQGQTPVSKSFAVDSIGNSAVQYTVNMDTPVASGSILSPLNSVLDFTKNFADTQKPTYDWSPLTNSALSEFTSGNLAFYIGFASEANYIKSANQKLYFDYTILPQVDGSQTSTTYGKLYSIFMLKTSPNPALAYPVMYALATGPFSQNLSNLTGGLPVLKSEIQKNMSSGDHSQEVFGSSALISKTFYDLHRSDLEISMKKAINQVYNGEKSTVEASQELNTTLQSVYNGGQ